MPRQQDPSLHTKEPAAEFHLPTRGKEAKTLRLDGSVWELLGFKAAQTLLPRIIACQSRERH